jgi:hypothetical protein
MQTNYDRPIHTKIKAPAQDIAFLLHELRNTTPNRWVKDYVKDAINNCMYIVNVIAKETQRDTEQTAAIHQQI